MPSIFDPQVRTAIVDRISRLTPERKPVWGRFTAPEMVCHVSCDLRQGLGELEAGRRSGPLARFPLNWLAIHVLPWPKGKGKSPPEFLATRPTTWAADVGRLRELIQRSEEHTSELQSRLHLVCRLLLEKKKRQTYHIHSPHNKYMQY